MKNVKKRRQNAQRKGHVAEYIAAAYLMLKGYRVRQLRYKTKVGEIDLIATKGQLSIFIEVKARNSAQAGVDAVSHTAQRRIKSASDIWLSGQKNPHLISQRYDIIVISPWTFPKHFLDAF